MTSKSAISNILAKLHNSYTHRQQLRLVLVKYESDPPNFTKGARTDWQRETKFKNFAYNPYLFLRKETKTHVHDSVSCCPGSKPK